MDNMETALNKFLLSKKLAGLTEQSLTHYSEINRSFASDCLSEPVSAITVEYYQTYFLSLYDRHLSKATVSTYIRHIKIFLKWLEVEYNLDLQTKMAFQSYADNDTIDVDDTEEEKGFYMPVQRVCRPNHEFRGFQGQIEAGSVSVGDEIITLPTKEHVHVKSIHVGDKEAQTASIGQPVTIQLDREVDVSRGSVLAAGADLKLATEITATILWMDDDVLINNKNFFVKLGTRLIPGVVTEIVNTIDVNTGEEKPATLLKKNEIAVCKISLADVIVVDEFNLHKTMGELILIDRVTNMTSACGVVREVNEEADDVKEVDAAFRAELNNQKPVVVETVLSDKINVDFLKKVEKELLLDSKHVYLYVPAEGEDYTNVVTHLVNAGIVVILALSKAADIKIDGAEVLAGWESEVDATTVDVAAYIKKNA